MSDQVSRAEAEGQGSPGEKRNCVPPSSTVTNAWITPVLISRYDSINATLSPARHFEFPKFSALAATMLPSEPKRVLVPLDASKREANAIKNQGVLFSPARYIENGAARCEANVVAATALVADIDGKGPAEIDDIKAALAPFSAFGYVGFSHRSAWKPGESWRFVVAIDREITPAEFPLAWAAFNELVLGGRNDPRTHDICRPYFLPRMPEGAEWDGWANPGKPALCVDELLRLGAEKGVKLPAKREEVVPAEVADDPRDGDAPDDVVARARAYVARIPGAVEGKADGNAMRAVIALVRGFLLSDEQALDLFFSEFSPRSEPQWADDQRWQIERKIAYVVEQGTAEWGYLLGEADDGDDLFAAFGVDAGETKKDDDEPELPPLGSDAIRAIGSMLPKPLPSGWRAALAGAVVAYGFAPIDARDAVVENDPDYSVADADAALDEAVTSGNDRSAAGKKLAAVLGVAFADKIEAELQRAATRDLVAAIDVARGSKRVTPSLIRAMTDLDERDPARCGRELDGFTAKNGWPAGTLAEIKAGIKAEKKARGMLDESDSEAAVRLTALAERFCDLDGTPFATFAVGEHRETWRVRSPEFRRWLVDKLHDEGRLPSAQIIETALLLAESAAAKVPRVAVHVRVGEHEGKIYLDLGDDDWRVVEVTAAGWSIVSECPVRFRRTPATRPLPTPVAGGSLDELRPFVNVPDDADWLLGKAWLVATLRPDRPFPILSLLGRAGSAKSTTTETLRSVIDPAKAPLRGQPKTEEDLMVTASGGWILALNNLSSIPHWLSDALACLSTGAGYAGRARFTDDGQHILEAKRPIIINGIENVGAGADLLDRCIQLTLPKVSARKTEDEIRQQFARAHPRILGALLDAATVGLCNVGSVVVDSLPRMADFARWGCACASALGATQGEFLAAYAANREAANDDIVEMSPLAQAVIKLVDATQDRAYSAAKADKVLADLDGIVDNDAPYSMRGRGRDWPTSPKALSAALRRLQPSLEQVGITITFPNKERSSADRKWIFRREPMTH